MNAPVLRAGAVLALVASVGCDSNHAELEWVRPILQPSAAGASAPIASVEPEVSAMGSAGRTEPAPSAGTGAAGMSATVGGSPAAARPETPPSAGSAPQPPAAAEECRPFTLPKGCETRDDALPQELRCTGLYGDWQARKLACGVRAYTPAFELWSDGARKRRFVSLPPNAAIDARDPDSFVYPVGTQFWKEFSLETSDGQRVLGETRLLRKTARGWLYTSYVWSKDQATATATSQGVPDLFGTGHSVPSRDQCKTCHKGRPDFVLGWDYLLLGRGAEGVTRDLLVRDGVLPLVQAEIPGDEIERRALGYLHVNCGVCCHNANRSAEAHDVGLELRLEVGDLASVHSTDVVRTGINRRPTPAAATFSAGLPSATGTYYDLRPRDRARSLVLARMGVRGFLVQMPQIGSNRIDPDGMDAVGAWIDYMTPERGYPTAAP